MEGAWAKNQMKLIDINVKPYVYVIFKTYLYKFMIGKSWLRSR